MEFDIFRANVSPGAPATQDEIKMLLCYILSNMPQPMSFAELHEALMEDSLVNYFELVRAVDGLSATGHIVSDGKEDGPKRYTVTQLGRQAAEAFTETLPLSMREKAIASAQKLLKRQQRESEVSITVRESDGGYLMELSIPDHGVQLISFSVFAPDREQCERIRRCFLNDPQYIYKGVISLLTGNEEVLGQIFPQKETLF